MGAKQSHAIDELKKGTAEMLILSVLSHQARHGYEIAKEIGRLSGQSVHFRAASLYPLLYRMERRGWIQGRWKEKAGQRRRRYYCLTVQGKQVLGDQLSSWRAFVAGIDRIIGVEHA